MPRPRKRRHVCCLPEVNEFGPIRDRLSDEIIKMSVDEYETIRLMDYVGFTQEECAKQMNVARTTVQGIYDDARKKIAEAIVSGKKLVIEGGEYIVCDEEDPPSIFGGCDQSHHRRGQISK